MRWAERRAEASAAKRSGSGHGTTNGFEREPCGQAESIRCLISFCFCGAAVCVPGRAGAAVFRHSSRGQRTKRQKTFHERRMLRVPRPARPGSGANRRGAHRSSAAFFRRIPELRSKSENQYASLHQQSASGPGSGRHLRVPEIDSDAAKRERHSAAEQIAEPRMRQTRLWILAAFTLSTIVIVFFLPRYPQNPAYHQFADHRTFFGIPNCLNVISNALFLLVGALGLAFLFRPRVLAKNHLFSIRRSAGPTPYSFSAWRSRALGPLTTILLQATAR